jgi:hypothetical protein
MPCHHTKVKPSTHSNTQEDTFMLKKTIALVMISTLITLVSTPLSGATAKTVSKSVTLTTTSTTSAATSIWQESVWPSRHWSLPYVKALVSEGVFTVKEIEFLNAKVGPDKPISAAYFDSYASRTLKIALPNRILSSNLITRERMVHTLYQMLQYAGTEAMPSAEALDRDGWHWKDANRFEGYGYQAALALRAIGIVEGSGGHFYPERIVTLAEALTVLAKTRVVALRTPAPLAPAAAVATKVRDAVGAAETTSAGQGTVSPGVTAEAVESIALSAH